MHVWEWETFEEVVNSAACSVTNPGPLRAPIDSLSTVSYTHLDVYKRQVESCQRCVASWGNEAMVMCVL